MSNFTQTLLGAGPVPAEVQRALWPEFPELADNPDLDPEAFDGLWHRRRDVDVAVALAGRPLDDDHLATVLSTERRTTPLTAALRHNRPARRHFELLASRPLPAAVAAAAALHPLCPDDLAGDLAARATTSVALWWAAGRDVDDDEIVGDLTARTNAVGNTTRSSVVEVWRAVCTLRPAVAETVADPGAPGRARLAAAGTTNLSPDAQLALCDGDDGARFRLLSLVANPALVPETLEHITIHAERLDDEDLWAAVRRRRAAELPGLPGGVCAVSDPNTLSRLVRRTRKFPDPDRHPASVLTGKAWAAVELSGNPHLSREHRDQLAAVLESYAARYAPLRAGLLASAFAAAAGRLGTPASLDPPSDPELVPRPRRFHEASVAGRWVTHHDLAALSERLGTDPAAWRAALALGPDFAGSLEELADTARALA